MTSPAHMAISESPVLVGLGVKFSPGGTHLSRTLMLKELTRALELLPLHAPFEAFREEIVTRNALGKATESTRKESVRRLRELYGLDESIPLFHALRLLHAQSPTSLPLLALLVTWCRDPVFRATTGTVLNLPEGAEFQTQDIANALKTTFGDQYTENSIQQTARHAASSWTQSGHLAGAARKTRQRVNAPLAAVVLALFLGKHAGFASSSLFANPWLRLLDLNESQARARAGEANRAGLLHLRSVGEVVEVDFPLLAVVERELS
jgi:hypothetical protein